MKNLFLILATWSILFISCQNELDELSSHSLPISKVNANGQELAFPDLANGEVKTGYYHGREITYTRHNDYNVYEGDILIRDKDILDHGPEITYAPSGVKSTSRSVGRVYGRWPNNIVYYSISSALPNQERVHEAIKHWESLTHLKFKVKTSEKNYIYFRTGSGCSSYVGMQGGRQDIHLADGCTTGTVIHEIGHAIGLFHEQNRIDRNQYVKIHYENIKPKLAYNFYSVLGGRYKAKDFTDEMDFQSVMLYNSYAFSKNGKPTITKLNGETYETNREGLSDGDITGINQMYPEIAGDNDSTYLDKYQHRTWYIIDGLSVYYYNDQWYYWHRKKKKWYEVVNINGKWYYKK